MNVSELIEDIDLIQRDNKESDSFFIGPYTKAELFLLKSGLESVRRQQQSQLIFSGKGKHA